MAGHSKWANIKRQKARVDAKKGKTFTQLSRAIIVAARNGIPDPSANFQLRTAIERAKAAGMPSENIERAIQKGAGTYVDEEAVLEEIRYEGYAPGGVAVLIEALTDNRNRTAADLRAAFNKNGGRMGETGCVSWMFERKGVVTIDGAVDEEHLLETCVNADALSYEIIQEDDYRGAEVFTTVEGLERVSEALKSAGFAVKDAELRWIPKSYVEVSDPEQIKLILRLMETLESLDDVQNVTANFDLVT
ncbi:MAG: YebC/PmpR family DNA-binding transcriptional regulator [Geminocystis sp.]|nr:YebC/PmpR family DNA-binding transcriptional regulator [Geminocystis sp.]MCS7147859.1 YebC/PmpR family DNA-binding transcriptional regulator [Geminocystis sp.]MCX8079100.1 YebC/PmpR family DNA-binding transcriptional regulator [Geminocystis sp.]MDW8117055.1 YebC/PmpR family DNA-binding transcriptional regulator [Geminocystis sp.]HIK38794.1 YebC/PmpR family DNA-binding transcriptional regulator [Geminocystis sp. M7585_C2015_104]